MKFYIETYGCQMNVSDSELITTILIKDGYAQANSIDDADVILFNTCSVRAHAEERVLGRITNEQYRRNQKPELKIGILGCMAQRVGKRLLEQGIGIDFAVGVDNYHKLPMIITGTDNEALDFDQSQNYDAMIPTHANGVCGFVTIMRGCDNFCTYCIVPHVRGRERSRSLEDIRQDIIIAVQQGVKDITLLGQNVNSYSHNGMSFAKLLETLGDIDGVLRYRFVTSHPKDLSDDLIRVMQSSHKICEHIHLPMQSGDDTILNRMNRYYDYNTYLKRIHALRKAMPEIAITTDLIAGFPGETEEQFEATLNAMREIEFDYAFCFKYSPREGTTASNYADQISEATRLARLQKMIDLQREITLRKFKAQIGKTVEVLIEDYSKKSKEQVSGKTRDYKIAVLDGKIEQVGTLVSARVADATAGTLLCVPTC